jgi:hypothetical protein
LVREKISSRLKTGLATIRNSSGAGLRQAWSAQTAGLLMPREGPLRP